MQAFDKLTAIAAPLPMTNIDTDKIFAAEHLKTIQRSGLGAYLFSSLRTDPQFILNREPWNKAGILVTLDNFGCGSSREHAPWSLLDFGIRCIIAPSIADIFFNNATKNGILPICLPRDQVDILMKLAGNPETASFEIDLKAQRIVGGGLILDFEIDATRKRDLMLGQDEIKVAMLRMPNVELFEQRRRASEPWRPTLSITTFGMPAAG